MKTFVTLATFILLAGCASAKKQTSAETTHATATSSPTASVKPASEKATELLKLSCTKGSDKRTLEVQQKTPGCALEYSKFGKTATAASSIHGLDHCVKSQTKIRTKLEKSGFSCI